MVTVLLLASAALPCGASAAVFTTTPPATMVEGTGPITWAFESDAPGTMWGNVTWKVSTEPEWHMCGGPNGGVTLDGPGVGTYWVEIADEVDLGFAGEAAGAEPFARCSESHSPALGPLHPLTLDAVTVVPRPAGGANATTTVIVRGPRCPKAHRRRAPVPAHRHRSRPGCGSEGRAPL